MRKTTIITDPVHQVMNLGSDPVFRKCFRAILDTKAFQRLRRITQLGLTSYVFPGATHTRFSHSVGVAYLAHAVLTHLREWTDDNDDREELNEVFDEVLIAALLHDVGHGPFSHSFEKVLKGDVRAPLHEEWTAMMISHERSEICQRLTENDVNIKKIVSIFSDSHTESLPRPYQQIVSSQLDVDRMDYLVRDSHFAGVAIGRFDVHYLINSLVIVRHDTNGTKTLGITPKGVKAYEAFLLARQLMNRTLYYHHNIKVLEFMMEHFLRLVIAHANEISAHKFLGTFLPGYLRRVSDAIANASDKREFMNSAYEDYVRLTEDSIWSLLSAVADTDVLPDLQTLAQRIQRRQILSHFRVVPGKCGLLREALLAEDFADGVDFQLIDLRTTMYKGNDRERVFVLDWQERLMRSRSTLTSYRLSEIALRPRRY